MDLDPGVIDGMNDGYQILAEFYRLKQGGLGALRSWLDRNWKVASDRVAESKLHKLIVELDFPTIYTTNYDRNLETAFEVYDKPYAKIVNAKQIADATDGVTQIIKYHGDFDDDSSLVLTETDFLDRLSFDLPWISSFGQMRSAAQFCSSDTACRIPTYAGCSIISGRPGKDPVMRSIGRVRLYSCPRPTLYKRPCWDAGELPFWRPIVKRASSMRSLRSLQTLRQEHAARDDEPLEGTADARTVSGHSKVGRAAVTRQRGASRSRRRADIAGTGLVLLPVCGCCHCSRASEVLGFLNAPPQAMRDLASNWFWNLAAVMIVFPIRKNRQMLQMLDERKARGRR
jgi:hypothetical protein